MLQANLLENTTGTGVSPNSDLLSLSAFVGGRMAAVLTDNNSKLLDALISINRDIAQGQLAA